MTIRNYHKRDYEACMAIFRSNLPVYFAPHELEQFEKYLKGREREHLTHDGTDEEQYFVLEHDNNVVACGGFYVAKAAYSAFMTWGMVDQTLHKKGFGKKLLEYRIQRIKHLFPGYSILLDTTQHSFQFFEKMGFETTKISENFYTSGMHRYDMIRKIK